MAGDAAITGVCPRFWLLFVPRLFGCSPKFAAKLWLHFPASQALIWQLDLCRDVPEDPQRWLDRLRHLGALLPPQDLLGISVALHPETGRPRPREAVQFESSVLDNLDQEGRWVW